MRRLLCLTAPLLLLIGCRPHQAEIDEINRRLDELSAQQQQLVANLDTRWAAERQAGPQEGSAGDPMQTQMQLDELSAKVDGLAERVGEMKDPRPRRAGPRPGRPDPNLRYRVDVGSSPTLGPDDALVTIIAYVSYQCPFSKRVQPTLKQVRNLYGRDVRIVHKHNQLPMHNRSRPAAIAAEAARRQGKFWEMHARIFEHQRELTDENLETFAKDLQLDMKRFRRDLRDQALRDRIDDDQKQGVQVGARGTPAFFVNGRFLSGAQPLRAFEELIDEELAEAKKLVKRGTKRRNVYEQLMKDARSKV